MGNDHVYSVILIINRYGWFMMVAVDKIHSFNVSYVTNFKPHDACMAWDDPLAYAKVKKIDYNVH